MQHHDGLSFRHAFELLAHGQAAAFASQPLTGKASVPKLPCPLDPEADDATLFNQVLAYYHERLKQSPFGRGYLASRGLDQDELITHFQAWFCRSFFGVAVAFGQPQGGRPTPIPPDATGLVAGKRARAF